MPLQERARLRRSSKAALDLPPPFRLVTLREVGDAFAHATDVAGEEGAGTLVYVGRFDLVEFALVLEPDEPLKTARRALYAGLAALADALAVHAPPELPIAFDWPDAVRVNGGLVGGGRLAWPQRADESQRPDWLVFAAGAGIRGHREELSFPARARERGAPRNRRQRRPPGAARRQCARSRTRAALAPAGARDAVVA
jgi:hypothetical protein